MGRRERGEMMFVGLGMDRVGIAQVHCDEEDQGMPETYTLVCILVGLRSSSSLGQAVRVVNECAEYGPHVVIA